MSRPLLCCVLVLLALSPAECTVRLPKLFTDHMVLEAREALDLRPFVFGWADPGEEVRNAAAPERKREGVMCVRACVCVCVCIERESLCVFVCVCVSECCQATAGDTCEEKGLAKRAPLPICGRT